MGANRMSVFSDSVPAIIITIVPAHGNQSILAVTVGRDFKGKLSPVLFTIAIPSAFVQQWIAGTPYVLVALMRLIPRPTHREGIGQ